MNPKALAILALADKGITPKPDPAARDFATAMITDCLPYYRQQIDAISRDRAIYEARAQDVSLSERDRQYARGMVEAIDLIDAEISMIEQGLDTYPQFDLEQCSPFLSIHVFRFYAPPSTTSPYFKRRSVKAYLPYWYEENWMCDDVIGNRHYELWLKRGRKNHVNSEHPSTADPRSHTFKGKVQTPNR